MTITYVWSDTRDRAVAAFGGELPGAETEVAVIEVFERRPALVVAVIESVAEAKASGSIRSGWAILRKRLEAENARAETVTHDGSDRFKRIARAEQWVHAAGKHFGSGDEVLDELFDGLGGDRYGPLLGPWRSDESLRQRMLELWREVRPEGETIERQAIERGAAWQAHRKTEAKRREQPVEITEPVPALIGADEDDDDIPF